MAVDGHMPMGMIVAMVVTMAVTVGVGTAHE
jgi:hypothetical protein